MNKKLLTILTATTLAVVSVTGAWAQVDGKTNQQWWPNRLDLTALRQHSPKSNPMRGGR